MSTSTGHMSLADRRAYVLQAAFHAAARKVAAAAKPDELHSLEKHVWTFVEKAFNRNPQADLDLDRFLDESLQRIKGMIQAELGEQQIPPAALEVLEEMHKRAAQIRCADCLNGRICDGNDADDEIVTEGGECIGEVKHAFSEAFKLAQAVYLPYATSLLPILALETRGVTELNTKIPGHKLAFGGIAFFADENLEKFTRINVNIVPDKVNREDLAALPYIVMHEVFCHGFQMATYPSGRPKMSSEEEVDPVSEGMMDALIVELFKDLATKLAGSDPATATVAKRNFEAAQSLHGDRASLDRYPQFPQAPIVRLGRSALEAVRSFYENDPPTDRAEQDVRALACVLNLAGWNYVDRLKGLTRLVDGLQKRPRDKELVKLLLSFRRGRNTERLISHLCEEGG